jgi:hypothetical protein
VNDDAFYRRWILANGWAEAVGLGSTFVLGVSLAPRLEGVTSTSMVLLGAVVAVVLGTLLEGVVVGMAQERVLRARLPSLPPGSWVVATAAGAGLAWLLGMMPSTILALRDPGPSGAPPAEPPALMQYALALLLGVVAGPVLGLAQWMVLRKHVPRAARWLGANAAAWAVGMPLIFVGMDRVPWQGPAVARAVALYAVCGVAGLAVGAVHGRVLVGLLRGRSEGPREREG